MYIRDRVVSTLGCTERYQFCANGNCSALTGLYANETQSPRPYLGLTLNAQQKQIFNLVWNAAWGLMINHMPLLGDEMLVAQKYRLTAETRMSAPLPPTQWQAEVVNMANIMLAALQRRIVNYASPPNMSVPTLNGSSSSLAYVTPPDDEGEQLCQNIRIRDASYFNFSVAGLLLILFLGGAIIGINLFCLPGMLFWARRRLGMSDFPRREWLEGHLLLLQRTALEGNGIGPWEVDDKSSVPLTVQERTKFSASKAWPKGDELGGEAIELMDGKK
jgi:hypothetical protein